MKVSLRKGTTYWNGTGWQATATSVQATLSAPGTTATNWAYTWAIPAGSVRVTYNLTITATDSSGKLATTTRSFSARG